MGLADLLGIADLHCRKVESTKWLKHKLCHVRRPIVCANRWQIWVSFFFEVYRGTAGICHTKLSQTIRIGSIYMTFPYRKCGNMVAISAQICKYVQFDNFYTKLQKCASYAIKSYLEMPDLNELEVVVKFITSSNN